jgi:hypothetical protein
MQWAERRSLLDMVPSFTLESLTYHNDLHVQGVDLVDCKLLRHVPNEGRWRERMFKEKIKSTFLVVKGRSRKFFLGEKEEEGKKEKSI